MQTITCRPTELKKGDTIRIGGGFHQIVNIRKHRTYTGFYAIQYDNDSYVCQGNVKWDTDVMVVVRAKG